MRPEPGAPDPALAQQAIIEHEIIKQVNARGEGKSICPSEVARALEPENWRPLLKKVRVVAARLALAGQISITKKGQPVDPLNFKGVVRLCLPRPK